MLCYFYIICFAPPSFSIVTKKNWQAMSSVEIYKNYYIDDKTELCEEEKTNK